MENECDEMTKSDFRRWVKTNYTELKEHLLTQCKETKNLEKRVDEMVTRIKKNINDLMELKNTARELRRPYPSFDSWIDQAEERISETEDQLNEIKWESKIREKEYKEMNKASKKYQIM